MNYLINYRLYLTNGKHYKGSSVVHDCQSELQAKIKFGERLHSKFNNISQIVIDGCVEDWLGFSEIFKGLKL